MSSDEKQLRINNRELAKQVSQTKIKLKAERDLTLCLRRRIFVLNGTIDQLKGQVKRWKKAVQLSKSEQIQLRRQIKKIRRAGLSARSEKVSTSQSTSASASEFDIPFTEEKRINEDQVEVEKEEGNLVWPDEMLEDLNDLKEICGI